LLKTRVLTALAIAVTTFVVIFLLPPWGFRLVLAILWMTGSWEFTRLAGLGRFSRWALFLIQAVLLGLMIQYWNQISDHALTFLVAAGLTWCVMVLRLVTFRPGEAPGINYRMVSFFCALASISFAWFALAWLRSQSDGKFWVLLLVFIIWSADTGAYFVGRSIGRHKLAPQISPGKTREGLIGGIVLAVVIAILIARWTLAAPPAFESLVILTVATVLAAAAGDLFVSLHKRTVGLKDTGSVFPGHGGVLDRFDSLLAGAPIFSLGVLLLGS